MEQKEDTKTTSRFPFPDAMCAMCAFLTVSLLTNNSTSLERGGRKVAF
jgi:hypothetical protein